MSQFDRQSFLGASSAATLAALRVGVIGLGGGGSHIIQQLAHVGVGHITAADPDFAEDVNLNRLIGATWADVRRSTPKTEIASRIVRGLIPNALIKAIPTHWQEASETFRDCDIIFGCLDGYVERAELEAFCRRFLIPLIDIGMDVHRMPTGFVISGQVILSMPGQHCMRCFGFITEDALRQEAEAYGAAGGLPQVVWPNGVLASTAIGLAVGLVTPWSPSIMSAYFEYDGNTHRLAPSNRLLALQGRPCRHYPASDVGDPFFESRVRIEAA